MLIEYIDFETLLAVESIALELCVCCVVWAPYRGSRQLFIMAQQETERGISIDSETI